MMLFHTKRFTEPAKQIEHAKAFLTFMTQATGSESAYGKSLHEVFQMLSMSDESYLFHEQFEEFNEPVYFHQFADEITKHDLQYLCEVEQSNLRFNCFPPQISEVLAKMEIIEREQYVDFFSRRTFRQTLICHCEVTVDRDAMARHISKLLVSSNNPISPPEKPREAQPVVLKSRDGTEITIRDPLAKAAFVELGTKWPRRISFDESLTAVQKQFGGGSVVMQSREDYQRNTRVLQETLSHAFVLGAMGLNASDPAFTDDVSPRPVACPLVRHQAASSEKVTSRLHVPCRLIRSRGGWSPS